MNEPLESRNESRATGADGQAQLALLRLLQLHPDYSQRQLSDALGVSLGKTNYLVRALLDRGWVKMNNFRRSDRKLGYLYVLTPAGVRKRISLTRTFLARKEREYATLKTEIERLRIELNSAEAGKESRR